jgi:hypothetical protein
MARPPAEELHGGFGDPDDGSRGLIDRRSKDAIKLRLRAGLNQ